MVGGPPLDIWRGHRVYGVGGPPLDIWRGHRVYGRGAPIRYLEGA